MSTHNLCFRAKIRKICLPLVLQYESGVLGVNITRTCSHDALDFEIGCGNSLYMLVTLKICSTSPKLSNSLLCHSDLIRIYHSVQEIVRGNKILVKV